MWYSDEYCFVVLSIWRYLWPTIENHNAAVAITISISNPAAVVAAPNSQAQADKVELTVPPISLFNKSLNYLHKGIVEQAPNECVRVRTYVWFYLFIYVSMHYPMNMSDIEVNSP